jgi:hypothetical protein
VLESGILDSRNVGIQDTAESCADGCLAWKGMSLAMNMNAVRVTTFWDNIIEEVMDICFTLSRIRLDRGKRTEINDVLGDQAGTRDC